MQAKSPVSSLPSFSCSPSGGQGETGCASTVHGCSFCIHTDAGYRSWVLILGMSGLIVLFWFVEGGEALRYLVRFPSLPIRPVFITGRCPGFVYWCHVRFICSLGRDRYVNVFSVIEC